MCAQFEKHRINLSDFFFLQNLRVQLFFTLKDQNRYIFPSDYKFEQGVETKLILV